MQVNICTIIKTLKMQLKARLNIEFWKALISTLGSVSAIVTLISFIFSIKNPSCCVIILYVTLVVGGSFIIALRLTRRNDSIEIGISNNSTINVLPGDLFSFEQKTNYIVIPVNEYFDTVVNTKIVNPCTLHGQFINRHFNYNHPTLHQTIDDYLTLHEIEYKVVDSRPNEGGYLKKYPLGTCVPIKVGQVTYVLLALTHFDKDDHAYVELSEFGRCISNVCRFLEKHAGNNPSYMPLMGMGMSRLNQTGQFILKYTLDTIIGVKDLAIPGGLNIIVYPPVAKTLDLNSIHY